MKKGKEIGLSPIKCENKQGNDCLRDYHYRINDILYPLGYQYISSGKQARVLNQLASICKEIKECEFPQSCQAKKEEILERCRTIYKNLKAYDSDDDEQQSVSVVKYQVSKYLKDKREGNLNIDSLVKYLIENKEIANDYCVTNSLKSVQNEILEIIKEENKIE